MSRRLIVPLAAAAVLVIAAATSLVLALTGADEPGSGAGPTSKVRTDADGLLSFACGIHRAQRDLTVKDVLDGLEGEQLNAFESEVSLLAAVGTMDDDHSDLTDLSQQGSDAAATFDDSSFDEFRAKMDTACDNVTPTSPDAAAYAAYGCHLADDVRDLGSFDDLGGLDSPGVWEVQAVGTLAKAAAAADDAYADMVDPGQSLQQALQSFDEDEYTEALDDLSDVC